MARVIAVSGILKNGQEILVSWILAVDCAGNLFRPLIVISLSVMPCAKVPVVLAMTTDFAWLI
ncbi:MAG TPA: hypothetical protein PKL77_10625 [Candidatus Omnitrophota bacterium]|nr:hypothetical protein [Candidatus Omnitrophota bacterium]